MKTITVKGIGNVSTKPDYVVIRLSLTTKRKDYSDTMATAAERIEQLNTSLAEAGFEKGSLKTTNFTIDTDYKRYKDSNDNYHEKFIGYECRHKFKLAFDFQMERLSAALSAITSSKVQPKLEISFTVKKAQDVKDELLRSAAENARRKAEILCAGAGAKLGDLVTITYNWTEINIFSRTEFLLRNSCMAMPSMDMDPDDIETEDTATFVWEIVSL